MDSKVTLELPLGCEVVLRKIDTGYDKECSFCGKHRLETKRLILARNVSICNECIELTHAILVDEDLITVKEEV